MICAQAPGKLVLSGAYSVLFGAPALVAAVDRYVTADARRLAALVTPEVRSALGSEPAPWFDASSLRQDGKKLGLGSSAAILLASLATRELALRGSLDDGALRAAVYERALATHRSAQGGGSGADIAASAHGGVVGVRRKNGELEVEAIALPAGLTVEAWWSQSEAQTSAFLSKLAELERRAASEHARCIAAQSAASEAALDAVRRGDAVALIASLEQQARALGALTLATGAPIVTREMHELARLAHSVYSAFLPAGAGGGDIACYFGEKPSAPEFRAHAAALGFVRLELTLGARGLHAMPDSPAEL